MDPSEDVIDLTACSPPGGEPAGPCPVCGRTLLLEELPSHCEVHFLEESEPAGPEQESEPIACDSCGELVAQADYQSHYKSHEIQQEEQQLGAAERAAREQRDFVALQARYGFALEPRRGSCLVCGQPGHWARECPRQRDNLEAMARVVRPPDHAALLAAQRAQQGGGGTGLVARLAERLRQGGRPGDAGAVAAGGTSGSAAPRAFLCGPVEHYASDRRDSGWGCGWRNIQQLASHLLVARPDAAAALFGGAGFVPDISSLQAWLECAWAAGFDVAGAEQLGHSVQASRKWIGTTEAAALLRYFGLRAQIVDFGAPAAAPPAPRAGPAPPAVAPKGSAVAGQPAETGAPTEVHVGVECDGCSAFPILGPRYKSMVLPDYDLCAECHAHQASGPAAPFQRMLASRVRLVGQPAAAVGTALSVAAGPSPASPAGERLLQWVWRYFSEAPQPPSRSATPPEAAVGDGHSGVGGPSSTAGARESAYGPAAEQQNESASKRRRLLAQLPEHVVLTGRPPLYFQHEGHSRTIIGVESRPTGKGGQAELSLLVLDPSCPAGALAGALRRGEGWQALLRRSRRALRAPQYQLLYVDPGLAEGEELRALRLAAAAERYFC